jgi:hypothetical protein
MTTITEMQPRQTERPVDPAREEYEAALAQSQHRLEGLYKAISKAYEVRAGGLPREAGEPPRIVTALDIYCGQTALRDAQS